MITLIHGPVELIRSEMLAKIVASCGDDPEMIELNTTRLDGRSLTPAQLENACDTLPFLAEKRLVIVDGLLARLAATSKKAKADEPPGEEPPADDLSPEALKGQTKAFLAYFERVPESAVLVLMEEDVAAGQGARKLQEMARSGQAQIITAEKVKKNDLPNWIRARAQMRRVKLDPAAVMDLAEFVGDELRQLDQELIKLGDYAGHRTVTREDVRLLVPATRAASVFDLVDALGSGNGPLASRLMTHALDVDGEPPLRMLAMIARHYRQLIQVKAMQAEGARQQEIARSVGIFEWKMSGMINQANRHSFGKLEAAMEKILAADEAIKTGQMSDREAMDVLLAELIEK